MRAKEALRSKKAEGVRQEIWGILLTYNLVRREMAEVAEAAGVSGVSPLRISFRRALMLIRIFCMAARPIFTCMAMGMISLLRGAVLRRIQLSRPRYGAHWQIVPDLSPCATLGHGAMSACFGVFCQ